MNVVLQTIQPNTSHVDLRSNFQDERIERYNLKILSQDDDFIVIDKPADVRMNGDFEVTVEKLLWRAVPSLHGVGFKWIHQLDFATSGVLCIGLNREAAAIASLAFENRETEKVYLAVLEGHLHSNQWNQCKSTSAEDLLPKNIVDTTSDATITAPQDEVSWQNVAKKMQLDQCMKYLAQIANAPVETHSVDVDSELQELISIPYETLETSSKLRKKLRKYLKRKGAPVDCQELLVAPEARLSVPTYSVLVPAGDCPTTGTRVCQVDPTMLSQHVYYDAHRDRLVIDFPVAEIDGDFRMEVGHLGNPGRACTTCLQVLEHCSYQGRPITKVLLFPHTGRRHQLRVHTASIGHPIVGDWTYSIRSKDAVVAHEYQVDKSIVHTSSDECPGEGLLIGRDADRMMLHAHRLKIPLSTNYKPTNKASPRFSALYQQKPNHEHESQPIVIEAVADDPFLIENGGLQVQYSECIR